mmetsp:Transcript_114188/g.158453  ORF Transcript_114188/g.158453 Transcript_114188/m.158453 type:complete len:331 (+) Transcript_114188:177-1169(+)
MRMARPSAMAVLPTPGSPMNTGLFFWRRARIWMARSICSSRPTRGSIMPSIAALVKSLPNSSSAATFLEAFAPLPAVTPTSSLPSSPAFWPYSSRMSTGTCSMSTLRVSKTFCAPSFLSLMMARRMCAGSMVFALIFSASLILVARYFFAAGEKGISEGTWPLPLPMMLSRDLRASRTVTLYLRITLPATPEFSAMTPTRSISVVTALWPRRRDSSCAFQTTFSAFSLNFSNIMLIEDAPQPVRGASATVTEPAIEEPRKDELLEDTALELCTANAPPAARAWRFAWRLGRDKATRAAKAAAAAPAAARKDSKKPRGASSTAGTTATSVS